MSAPANRLPTTSAAVASPGRNDPCPCGSGKRYKDCCGRLEAAGSVEDLLNAALAAQQARQLDTAERLYRDALLRRSDLPDALHMLGVIRYEKGDDAEARSLILRALDLTGWAYPAFRHNLGLVIARADGGRADARRAHARDRYRRWQESRTIRPVAPRVDVVMPCFNHARYVAQALRSVFAQSYRRIRLIVIDDGSSDDSASVISRVLDKCPFPHRFIARDNRGAAATINEAVGMSDGEFVNVLNSDDLFEPDRIETLVSEIAGTGVQWGFSGVSFVDDQDVALDTLKDARAYAQTCSMSMIPFRETVGFSLITGNASMSSGNLFFSRSLFERVGGFREFRYNHDWDFALRALRLAEPAFVTAQTYRYRLHGANTIVESAERARSEANVIMREYLAWASTEDASASTLAPSLGNWGTAFIVTVLEGGMAELLDPVLLRRLADEPPPLARADSAATVG